ncbi:unnamed protein product [Cuscuta epithymum]|uniref:Myb-like domain-containing protein n=1 Tax=Cuscuta epithymum TaxID=186058 RepID=A0AAV0FIU7_9ASTE|nr:unnamed protein product [Cuscuta epithymum]
MPSMKKLEKIGPCTVEPPLDIAIEGGGKSKENNDLAEKRRDLKRKKPKGKDVDFLTKEWTKEQELALQRAYYSAKATPHFWKKVSKMVPGKSAQECFDRIHSDHMTPPQPRQRSRVKQAIPFLSPLCSSKLLDPMNPKPKKRISKKAVREMLHKQCKVERDTMEKDLFTLLEEGSTTAKTPDVFPSGDSFYILTPELKSDRPSNFSQLSDLEAITLFSPPVLKPIKNKALHDRYIDQLLFREAKRKAAFLRKSKCSQGNGEEHQKVEATTIQAAKNALFFNARDAIKQFQSFQTNQVQNVFSDGEDGDEDGFGYNDDDE